MKKSRAHVSKNRNFLFIAIAAILLTLPLFVAAIQQQQDIRQRAATSIAWATDESAAAVCAPNGSSADIHVTFSNTERAKSSTSMDVTVTDKQTGKSVNLGSIPGGQTVNGVIQTDRTSLFAGSVEFALRWSDGHSGTDKKTAAYQAVSGCAPQEEYPAPSLYVTQPPYAEPTAAYATPTTNPYYPTPTPTYGYTAPTSAYYPTPTYGYNAPTNAYGGYNETPYAVPTFYCLAAPCPITPSVSPTVAYGEPTTPPQYNVEPTQVVQYPDPCVDTNTATSLAKHKKSKHKNRQGGVSLFGSNLFVLINPGFRNYMSNPAPQPYPDQGENPCPPPPPSDEEPEQPQRPERPGQNPPVIDPANPVDPCADTAGSLAGSGRDKDGDDNNNEDTDDEEDEDQERGGNNDEDNNGRDGRGGNDGGNSGLAGKLLQLILELFKSIFGLFGLNPDGGNPQGPGDPCPPGGDPNNPNDPNAQPNDPNNPNNNNPLNPEPTIVFAPITPQQDPCASTASLAGDRDDNGGGFLGIIQTFLKFISEFLNLILQLFGLNTGSPQPGTPAPTDPSTPFDPTVPGTNPNGPVATPCPPASEPNPTVSSVPEFPNIGVTPFVTPPLSLAPSNPVPSRQVLCPQDVRTCPNGEQIGRSGPNCEFICSDGTKL